MNEPLAVEDDRQDWYFTFGCGQAHAGHYTVIFGTYEEARTVMNLRYNRVWCWQYASAEEAGVAKWDLKRLP